MLIKDSVFRASDLHQRFHREETVGHLRERRGGAGFRMIDLNECEIIVCGGNAKPSDLHLASMIHCIDDDVIPWLEWRGRVMQ
jgi:hypothetical protein